MPAITDTGKAARDEAAEDKGHCREIVGDGPIYKNDWSANFDDPTEAEMHAERAAIEAIRREQHPEEY